MSVHVTLILRRTNGTKFIERHKPYKARYNPDDEPLRSYIWLSRRRFRGRETLGEGFIA